MGGVEAYVPAFDFSEISVRELLEAIDNQNRKVSVIPDDFTRDYVDSLMKQLGKSDSAQLDSLSFSEMIAEIDTGEKRANRSAVVMK